MNFTIKQLSDDCDTKIRVRNFLFSQIRSEYGYGYIPSWHKDIIDLNKYYIDCKKNSLKDIIDLNKYYIDCKKNSLFYVEDSGNGRIIATIAVRQYDKNFMEFQDLYSKESTASIWRLFVDKYYRRCGLATQLYNAVEEFCYENNFNEIYLHTHKNLEAGFSFWKKVGFNVTWDTNNELQTVHMVKNLSSK